MRLQNLMEVFHIANEHLINEQIRERSVRVISDGGEQLGIMSAREAMGIAEEKGMDLVMISPAAQPPVCKIMDYGKFRFEQAKKQKEAKKNQKIITLKEVRLSPTIDTHDLDVKAKSAVGFLKEGDKVKVSLRFKGRQMTHTDKGLQVMNEFFTKVADSAAMEKSAKLEGRSMFMILAPKN
jgi:translation initiation factor IF-3